MDVVVLVSLLANIHETLAWPCSVCKGSLFQLHMSSRENPQCASWIFPVCFTAGGSDVDCTHVVQVCSADVWFLQLFTLYGLLLACMFGVLPQVRFIGFNHVMSTELLAWNAVFVGLQVRTAKLLVCLAHGVHDMYMCV